MSKSRRLPWSQRLRAAASILTVGAVSAARYGPLVDARDWNARFGGALDSPYVDEHTALNVSAVWACASLLADGISALPVHVYQRDGDKRTLVVDHPANALFSRSQVNDFCGPRTLIKTAELSRQLGGNGFVQIERDGPTPVGLWPLRSAYPKRLSNGALVYETSANGERVQLPPTDVLHVRGLSHDGLCGLSPIAAARHAIGLAMTAEKFGSEFFKNEAKSGGFLSHPGKLSPTAKKNIKTSFEEQAIDAATKQKEAHNIKVLEEGMKFTPTTIAPEEAQFLASRQFQVEEIARWYRVPLVLIQSVEKTSSWGTGVEQLMIAFSQFTLGPLAASWEEELSAKLLTDDERTDGYYIKLDMRQLMRGDAASRAAYYASGIQNQWLEPSEIRAWEDLNPLPGGEAPRQRTTPTNGGPR